MIADLINAIIASPLILVKGAILILLVLYILFGVIVLRQTQVMNKVIETEASSQIMIITIIHLLGIVFLFLWASITL